MKWASEMPATTTVDVAIVGGGIAGLSTAWYLEGEARKAGMPLRYALLEAADRWGGHILTEHVPDGAGREFIVEAGPDSFITQKPWGLQLARELGLGAQLLGTNDHLRQTYVLHRGKPAPLPDGVMLIVPTRFAPFAMSALISPLGKLRMGMDLFIPPRRDDGDETLADFVRRRLGSEALDKIAEPLLSGIYNAEAERQSLLATFPRFRALEKEHGSLTRGMLAARKAASHAPAPGDAAGGKLSAFVSLRGGTADLVEALVARLSGELRLGCAARTIRFAQDRGYTLETTDGARFAARALVLAVPAHSAADLLSANAPQTAELLRAIRYVSTGTVSLAYRETDIRKPLRGFGLVVPRSERRPINAVTISSIKFDGRAPGGRVLLRVFFGGSRSPQSTRLDDDALLGVVRAELKALLDVDAAPLFHRIYRWDQSNAQYDVGHLDRVAAMEAMLPAGLYLTGSAYRGVGIPDCIKQGMDTAHGVVEMLRRQIA